MDKKTIISKVIKELEKQIEEAETGVRAAHDAALDAPGAMQSHSDTTKFQMNVLADKLRASLVQKQKAVHELNRFASKAMSRSEIVQVGSLVEALDQAGEHFFYFILPAGGGVKITYEEIIVVVLNVQAPLAAALIGKKKGDTVVLKIPGRESKELQVAEAE